MGSLSRNGQVLLETLLFMLFGMGLILVFSHYEEGLKRKQKTYRWEKRNAAIPKHF
jgi:hypothetical protein